MNSHLLKWIANGLISAVLVSTVWLAHTIRPDQGSPSLMLAHVTPAAASPAASAPATAMP